MSVIYVEKWSQSALIQKFKRTIIQLIAIIFHGGIVLFWLVSMLFSSPTFAETLEVPGAGNPEYILEQLAQAFNSQQNQHRVTVPTSTGTAGALRDIKLGAASLARVGRRITDEESGGSIQFISIGRDPVVFVAGADVTVASITPAQAVAAYRGEVSDWRDLGGTQSPIRVIGREETDASRLVIMRHINSFKNIVFADTAKVVHLDPQMIELLDRFPTSLGFLNRSALFACKSKIKILALDGVEPTPESVSSGRYPLFLEFGLIRKSKPALTAVEQAFIGFIQSPVGSRILQDHGVIPSIAKP
jgi:phosphate transport system substrate-binding protein